MRIGLVTLRYAAPGGVETTVRQLAEGLGRGGDEVTVFATDLYDEGRWEIRRDRPDRVDGVRVQWFPVYKRLVPNLTLPLPLGLVTALARADLDVIHAHSHRYGHVLESAAVARRTGARLVVSTHYHPADPGELWWKRWLLRGQDHLFGTTAYRVSDRLLVETELEARQVAEFAPRGRITVIPPGIELGEWDLPETGEAGALRLPPRYVLFAGRIAPNKGLETLFHALAGGETARTLPLVLVGRDWGERPALERLARDLGLEGRVVWVGHVTDRATYRGIFRGAAAFVLPSEYEAFGLVLLEAMAAGVPIVATAVGGVPEVLQGGRLGRLVPPRDAPALRAALEESVGNPSEARGRIQLARGAVRGYSLDRMVESHRRVYREVLRGARGSAASSAAS